MGCGVNGTRTYLTWIFRLWTLLFAIVIFLLGPVALAQGAVEEEVKPIPLLTGSTGFISNFTGGQPDLHPIVTPLVLVPIGDRWLFETRATFETDLVEVRGRPGFHGGPVQKEVGYAQIDFIANPYMTDVPKTGTITVGKIEAEAASPSNAPKPN